MFKSVLRMFKLDRERLSIPRSVQNVIKVKQIWNDGIFRVGRNRYSMTFKFADINYAVASLEAKRHMITKYSEILNSLEPGSMTKITLNNHHINRSEFEKSIYMPMQGDEQDELRDEYNRKVIGEALKMNNSMTKESYVTVSIHTDSAESARSEFDRIGVELNAKFKAIDSYCLPMNATERLRVFYNFFREGEENSFSFDMHSKMRLGHDFRDYICPDSFEFNDSYFKMGDRYARAIFLKDYANFIKDDMITELCELNRTMMLSIDIVPIPTDEAMKVVQNTVLGVEKNITTWQQKQNAANNFSAVVPYDMAMQRNEVTEVLKDISENDQRLFVANVTIVHTAESLEQLNRDTEQLFATARKDLCQLATLRFQQMDGMNNVLPFGTLNTKTFRTFTTVSLAALMPFRAQEICHENGIYYGLNALSKNLIIADKLQLLNANEFILGVPGSGKSFTAKREILLRKLTANKKTDIIIIDPEREYTSLVKALGGSVIQISATSNNHINAMDINSKYGDGANPITLKSEFILSLCEQLVGTLDAKQKSLVDRCTANVYRHYQQGNYMGVPPTLQDFREELLRQPEPEAKGIALAIELFTDGSLNTFAQQTNVDTSNSLICYDILDLGTQLLPIGMLVVLDSIFNRVTRNREKGISTYIVIDEIYLLFQHEYSANFLFTLWKRVRKYGANCTGITQNVDDLLQSHTARTMLANSEFIVMLNQASTDRIELAKLLGISESQMSYITNVNAGCGLLKVGSALVPFTDNFPKDTKMYKLMSTKPGENIA